MITMEDVAQEIDLTKGKLRQALQCRGLAHVRLRDAAKQIEAEATKLVTQLREAPGEAALPSYIDVSFLRHLLDDYTSAQAEVEENTERLRLLRVPEAEIRAI